MECGEIQRLLSEYLDNILDPEARALVDGHLSTCKDCQEEVALLRALVRELGSLEPVEPPKDFLDQLHERIEQGSRLSKIIRTFFVPVRVKIPLQLAGAAVMAVLIFSVLHVQRDQYRMAEAPVSLTKERIAEDKAFDIAAKKGKRKGAPERQPAERREPIELALVFKRDQPGRSYAPGAALETAPVQEKRMRRSLAVREPVPKAEQERDEVAEDPLTKVTKLIEFLGGKVVAIEHEKGTSRPGSIHAEIPASQFSIFYNRLGELGDLQTAPKTEAGKDQKVIRVRIRLLSSG